MTGAFSFANPGFVSQDYNKAWARIRAGLASAGVTLPVVLDQTGERLVRDLQGEYNPAYATLNLWPKLAVLYGLLGGTAAAHALNWLNPVATDEANRLVYSGAITHSAAGITFDGSTSSYANTLLVPSASLAVNSNHLACYLRLSKINVVDMGCEAGGGRYFDLLANYSGNAYFENSAGGMMAGGVNTSAGWTCGTRTAPNAAALYKNGSLLATTTQTTTGYPPDSALVLGGRGPNGGFYSSNNMALASAGASLTAAQNAAYYQAVQAYLTARGINV